MNDIRLIHGDCLEVMRGFADGEFDAVVTDPPYLTGNSRVSIGGNGGVAPLIHKSESIGMPWGYSLDWVDIVGEEIQPKHWIIFCGYMMLGDLLTRIEKYAKISCLFTWRKINAPPMTRNVPRLDCEFIIWARHKDTDCRRAREFKSMVLDVPMPQAGCFASERILGIGTKQAAHPTQKPLAIITPFVDHLTNAGEHVLDPFGGSGTTAVACHKLGRRCTSIEIDEDYYNIAVKRVTEAQAQPLLF